MPELSAHVEHAPLRNLGPATARLQKRERHLAHPNVVRLDVVENLQRDVDEALVAARLAHHLEHLASRASVLGVAGLAPHARGLQSGAAPRRSIQLEREFELAGSRGGGDERANGAGRQNLLGGNLTLLGLGLRGGGDLALERARGSERDRGVVLEAPVPHRVPVGLILHRRNLLFDSHTRRARPLVVLVPGVGLALALSGDSRDRRALECLDGAAEHAPRLARVRRHRRSAQRLRQRGARGPIGAVPQPAHPLVKRPRPLHLALRGAHLDEGPVRRGAGRVPADVHPRQDSKRALRVRSPAQRPNHPLQRRALKLSATSSDGLDLVEHIVDSASLGDDPHERVLAPVVGHDAALAHLRQQRVRQLGGIDVGLAGAG